MATFFPLPKLGMNQEEGEIVSWLVAEGDTVAEGQPIVEIETDKATVEVEATASGVLARIVHGEGDVVPINGVIAVILAPGEAMPDEDPRDHHVSAGTEDPLTAEPTVATGLTQYRLSEDRLADTPRRRLGLAILAIQTIRRFEKWLLDHADLVHGPLHSSIGQEATATGTALALRPSDWLTSTHRAHHDVVAKLLLSATPEGFDPFTAETVTQAMAVPVQRTMAEIMGLEQGLCHGRGGSMHLWDREGGVMTTAIVGGGIPPAGGYALASKLRSTGDVGVASFGDGATRSEPSTRRRRWRERGPPAHPAAGEQPVLGGDLGARDGRLHPPRHPGRRLRHACHRRRRHRLHRHLRGDGAGTGPRRGARADLRGGGDLSLLPSERSPPRLSLQVPQQGRGARVEGQDPAVAFPRRLIESGLLTADEVQHVQGMANTLVAGCVAALTAEGEEGPIIPPELYPPLQDVHRGMLGPGLPELPPERLDETPDPDAEPITYSEAIQGVIGRSLEREPEAIYMGEEVGHLGGGVMGLTRAAVASRPQQVLSTPICENGFSGAALGAALAGMHPIIEFMYPDFTLEATDQLFNHIAKSRYMYGGDHEVPIVARTQISRGRGYGPQHSCDPAALFTSYPGWRVASPTTPADYVGCWNAAMLSRDPVLIIDDHRLAKTEGVLPAAGFDHVVGIGTVRLARPGRDVSVVTWGYAATRVAVIAAELAEQGIEVEVLDPRWLDEPSFPRAAVLESVGRTGAVVIAEDAQRSMSMGARILDYLGADLHPLLRTAPLRVTGLDVYSPVSRPLEAYVHIQDADIRAAILSAAGKDDA